MYPCITCRHERNDNGVETERYNLRAALEWCVAEPSRTGMGMRLVAALVWFWCLRGFVSQGIAWLEEVLKRSDALPNLSSEQIAILRAKCLYGTGALAFVQGEAVKARAQLAESLALFQKVGAKPWIPQTRYLIGLALTEQGDLRGARVEYEESLPLLREIGDAWSVAFVLILLTSGEGILGPRLYITQSQSWMSFGTERMFWTRLVGGCASLRLCNV